MEFLAARWKFISTYLPSYMDGLKVTILLSIIGVIFGTILGIIITLMRLSKKKFLNKLAVAYLEIIRGTPLLVQILIIYYPLINVIPKEYTFLRNKIFLVSIAICINSAAYVSEIIRAGIQSIDKGQGEAARSLGMTEGQTMRKVILPQAVKNILPALANEFVTLIKESAVVSFVALHDLMYYADVIRGSTYKAFEPLLMVAVIYFILTFTTSKLIGILERRLNVSDQRN